MRVTIILIIAVVSICGYVKAADWAIDDLYHNTPRILAMPIKPIDLRFKKETGEIEYKEQEKTLLEDFDKFAKEHLFTYEVLWAARGAYDPAEVKAIFSRAGIPNLLKNMTHWQGCNTSQWLSGKCSTSTFRQPWLHPTWTDGDKFKTKYIQHPAFGAGTFLYYRAEGFDIPASALGSIMLSFFFEYTVEGWTTPVGIRCISVTPALGIPLGIVLDEMSNLSAESDNQFLRALSYLFDPAKIVIHDRELSWEPIIGRTVAFRFSW